MYAQLRIALALILVVGGWPAAGAEAQTVVFADGFESGNVDAWSAAPGWTCPDEGELMAALQNLVIAGLPNPLGPDVVTITAGAEGSSNLAANLKTLEPWQFARLTSVFPHQSYWEVDFGSTALANARAFALGAHTLVPGDQVRVVGVESGALPAVRSETVAPDSVADSLSMINDTIGDIDEHPSSPDGNKTEFFTNGSYIRLTFGTPSATPAAATNCQAFLIWCNLSTAPTNPEDYPSLTVELWENGAKVADLGTKAPTSTTGQLLIFPWSASALGTADGSLVEVKIIQNQPAALRIILMDAVSWEVLSETDLSAADTDSGWQTITGAEISADWGGTAVQEVDLPPPLWHTFLSAGVTIAKARFEIRGDGAGEHDSLLQTPPRTPATAIDAGFLIVSPTYEFAYNFAPGGRLRAIPHFVGGETALTGSNRHVVQYRRREFEAEFEIVSESDADALFERLDYAAAGRAFLVSTQPAATGTRARNTTFLATVQEARGMGYDQEFIDGEPVRDFGYRFVEKL